MRTQLSKSLAAELPDIGHFTTNNNNDLQAFQLIALARYLLGVPKP
jgi:hypothetical protein